MRWTAVGVFVGVVLAVALTRVLERFLYGISPTDIYTFGGVTLMLVFVASVAALVPAVRASRLDSVVALRML